MLTKTAGSWTSIARILALTKQKLFWLRGRLRPIVAKFPTHGPAILNHILPTIPPIPTNLKEGQMATLSRVVNARRGHSELDGRNRARIGSKLDFKVSIRAPRVGGDSLRHAMLLQTHGFNPRPPRGGRRKIRYSFRRNHGTWPNSAFS